MVPHHWDMLARLLSRDRFPALQTFRVFFHGKVAQLNSAVSEMIMATAKRDLSHLEARGILTIGRGCDMPFGFLDVETI